MSRQGWGGIYVLLLGWTVWLIGVIQQSRSSNPKYRTPKARRSNRQYGVVLIIGTVVMAVILFQSHGCAHNSC
jgi:hypothetical protein